MRDVRIDLAHVRPRNRDVGSLSYDWSAIRRATKRVGALRSISRSYAEGMHRRLLRDWRAADRLDAEGAPP